MKDGGKNHQAGNHFNNANIMENYALIMHEIPFSFRLWMVKIYKFLNLFRSARCEIGMVIEFDAGIYFEMNDLNFSLHLFTMAFSFESAHCIGFADMCETLFLNNLKALFSQCVV